MPLSVPAGRVPSQFGTLPQSNFRRAMIRPVRLATQATKTCFARSTPIVVVSISTSLLIVKNELQQFNLGTSMPVGKRTGRVWEVLL